MRNGIRNYTTPHNGVVVRSVGETIKIGGLAAPFNREITHHGVREQILPQAFDKMLASNDEVKLFTDHTYKVENLLALRSANTLRLWKDNEGLQYEATLPPANDKINHILAMAKQGALGASIGGGNSLPWKYENQNGVRSYTEMTIDELSITAIPAFKETSVEQRSKQNDVWIQTFLARHEAIKRRFSSIY